MDIKRVTSALLGFPLVLAIFLIGNKYVINTFCASNCNRDENKF